MCLMLAEAMESPDMVTRQLIENQGIWQEICQRMRSEKITMVGTIARGSSDHAALFAKYLSEIELGLPTTSINPSVVTLFHQDIALNNALVFTFSQSGRSEDLCQTLQSARNNGALTVAIVNCDDSPLAEIAEYVIPLHAGPEKAVAATKSFIGMLVASLHFIALYHQDEKLLAALNELPGLLDQAWQEDWSSVKEMLTFVDDTLILGRGYGSAISNEAALKCKEVALLHAQSFSSAEFMHGPLALVRESYPLFMFTQNDATFASNVQVLERLHAIDAATIVAVPELLLDQVRGQAKIILPYPTSSHSLLDPILSIQAFYRMLPDLARARGVDPNKPRHINKVTTTL